MKKEAFFVLILLVLIGSVLASTTLSNPHGFYGEIIVTDGSNPGGKTLVGYVNNIATGSAIISSDGKYNIVVTGSSGEQIKFKIGTEEATKTFTFKTFEVTPENLTFDTIAGTNPCGNGIFEAGECSSCPIDCRISDCLGNGVCDSLVGETCSTAPADCGVCMYCGDGVCNNGETCSTCSGDCGACSSDSPVSTSGGGGGGGGGSSKKTNKTLINTNSTGSQINSNGSENELSDLSIDELNKEKESNIFSLTGRSILDFAKSGIGIGAIIFVVVVALTLGVIKFRKKNNPLKWKKN